MEWVESTRGTKSYHMRDICIRGGKGRVGNVTGGK